MVEERSKQDKLKELISEFGNQISGDQLNEELLEQKTKLLLDQIVGVVFPTKSLSFRTKTDIEGEKKFIDVIENHYTTFNEVKKSIRVQHASEVDKLENYRITQLKLIEGLGISADACEGSFKKAVDSIEKQKEKI